MSVKFLSGVLHIAEAALAHSLLFKHRQGAGACRQKLPAWECCSADMGETRAPEHRGDDSNGACAPQTASNLGRRKATHLPTTAKVTCQTLCSCHPQLPPLGFCLVQQAREEKKPSWKKKRQAACRSFSLWVMIYFMKKRRGGGMSFVWQTKERMSIYRCHINTVFCSPVKWFLTKFEGVARCIPGSYAMHFHGLRLCHSTSVSYNDNRQIKKC